MLLRLTDLYKNMFSFFFYQNWLEIFLWLPTNIKTWKKIIKKLALFDSASRVGKYFDNQMAKAKAQKSASTVSHIEAKIFIHLEKESLQFFCKIRSQIFDATKDSKIFSWNCRDEPNSRVFLLRQLWIVNHYVKSSSNNLSNENKQTGFQRILQKFAEL